MGKAKVQLSPEALARRKKNAKKVMVNSIILVILIMIIGIGLSSIGFYYFFMVLVVGMLPGIVAYMVDKGKGKLASRSVMALNFAGMSPHIVRILESGSPETVASRVLYDPFTWLIVYGFAAVGWVIIYIVPQFFFVYLSFVAEFQNGKMEKMQEDLAEEWGDDVRYLNSRNQSDDIIKKRKVVVKGEV